MIEPNLKHPNYNDEFLPVNKDIFKPEFKRDSRGRYFMQLPGYGKWMVSNEPGSKIIAQGSEDEKAGPATSPESLRTGSLHAETIISVGDDIRLDGGTGCIYVGDTVKRVKSSIDICGGGLKGYSGTDLIFAFFLEKDGDFGTGDVIIGDYSSDEYLLWDDSEGKIYLKGDVVIHGDITSANYVAGSAGYKLTYTSGLAEFQEGLIGDWKIDTCLKKEYTISAPSKSKIELCPGNPGHIQVAYSPTGSFSLPGDTYMVQLTQGSTGDSGGVPIPRMDVYRDGAKRVMLNSDGLYFFESDGVTVASSILSGATNQENLSNVEITGGNISSQPVANVGYVSNSTPDIVPTGLTAVITGTEVNDDGTITSYMTLTWNAISTDTFDHYLVRYKRNSYTYYNYIDTSTNTITIDGLMPNISYDFAVASVNKYGAISAFCTVSTQTTAGDSVAPAVPTGLILIGGFKKMVLDWDANTDYDLDGYKIYRYTSDNSALASQVGISGKSQFIDDLSSVSYSNGESVNTYYYWIKAVDTSRNTSGFSTEAHAKSKLIDEDSVYYIGASKILLDGTTYLTSWRHPTDFTKIDGGDIYANSVTVNEVNFTVVGTDNVVATINASGEGIQINASYITIAGTTVFTSGWATATNAEADINGSNIVNGAGWTDDTAADTAQTSANDAQDDADIALLELDDIAADNKITPVEKLTIKPLWDAIVAEKSDIDTQADTYSVSKMAYGTAYTNLNTYLNTTITVFSSMTTTTNITRTDWDSYWEAYYNAKVEILNAIASATAGDMTKTVIDGGVITTGNIILKDGVNEKAGITASGVGDTSIRIWAGQTHANKDVAPFRVTQGGKITANNAIITGAIKATSGYIGGTTTGWKIASNVMQAYTGVTKVIELSTTGPHIQCLKDSNNYVQMTPASNDPRFDVYVSGNRRIRLNANGLTFFTSGGAETNKIGLGVTDGDVTFGSGVVRCFSGGVRVSHMHGFHAADNGSTYYFQLYVDGTNDATYGYQNILSLSTSNYLKIENSGHGAIARFNGTSGGSWALDLYGNLALYTTTSDTGSTVGTMYFNTSTNTLRLRNNSAWVSINPAATLPSGGSYDMLRCSLGTTWVSTLKVYIGGFSTYYIDRNTGTGDLDFIVPTGYDYNFTRGGTSYAVIDNNFWTKGNLYADGQLSVGGTMTNTTGDIICTNGNLQLNKTNAIIAIKDSGGTVRYLKAVLYDGKYTLREV